MSSVKLIANHCVDNCGFDGVNLLNASGEGAGQSVPHFHIHIIPRKDKDGIEAWPAFEGSTRSREEMYELLRVKGTSGCNKEKEFRK